jgi:hypothetical protein
VSDIQRFERGELNTVLCYWGKVEDIKESLVPVLFASVSVSGIVRM